jgi:UrcA family protein
MKDHPMNTIAIQVLAAASLSLVIAAPAAAEQVQATVTYADLDVASPEGAYKLVERVQASVETVCARPETRGLKALATWSECRDTAMADASEQLARQGVTIG